MRFTRDTGFMINHTGRATRLTKMGQSTKVLSEMEIETDMALSSGQMDLFIKENGLKINFLAKVISQTPMETDTREISN